MDKQSYGALVAPELPSGFVNVHKKSGSGSWILITGLITVVLLVVLVILVGMNHTALAKIENEVEVMNLGSGISTTNTKENILSLLGGDIHNGGCDVIFGKSCKDKCIRDGYAIGSCGGFLWRKCYCKNSETGTSHEVTP